MRERAKLRCRWPGLLAQQLGEKFLSEGKHLVRGYGRLTRTKVRVRSLLCDARAGEAPVSMAGAPGAATRRELRVSACHSGQAQETAVRPQEEGLLPRRPAGEWRRRGQGRDSPACACPPG